MRALPWLTLLGLGLSGSLAAADPAALALPPIDPEAVPPSCAPLAEVPPDATIPEPALEARIAVASCGAEARFDAMTITPDDQGIAALNAAAAPSLALFDAVIGADDPVWSPVAQQAKNDMLASMAVRVRDAIPPITMQTVGAPLAEHDAAHAAIEPKIQPWLEAAG